MNTRERWNEKLIRKAYRMVIERGRKRSNGKYQREGKIMRGSGNEGEIEKG